MARWTQNETEAQHVVKITSNLLDKGLFWKITFNNGLKMNCREMGCNVSSDLNGKNRDNSKCRAELHLLDEYGKTHCIDVLDIANISKGKVF